MKNTPFRGMTDLSPDGDSVILRRFTGDFRLPGHATNDWLQSQKPNLETGAVIDVETTGLDRKSDTVIEIGLTKFTYHRMTGEIVAIGESYTGLQDPGHPLSQEISELTGLTDADLKGQAIDWARVDALLSDTKVILAHNAGFDRPFIDRHAPSSRTRLWGCSLRQIDWSEKSLPSAKLEVLCLYHGFFTAAHRAQNDVDALLQLVALQDPLTEKPYLHELLSRVDQPYVRVLASGSPFESKDQLKARGYRWNNLARVWSKMILGSALADEVSWLESSVYRGTFRGQTEEIPALENFKE